MATVSKFTRGAVAGNGWTSPANATADDGVYATAAPAKRGSTAGDWDFAAFTDAEIPVSSVINSVTVRYQWKVDTSASIADIDFTNLNNGTAAGTVNDASEPTTDTNRDLAFSTTPSITDLKTAGRLVARLSANRGNSNTAVTFSLDFIQITVDFTPPAVIWQNEARGRNDDGSETTATWIAAKNTAFSVALDAVFRLRFTVQETAGGTLMTGYKIMWRRNGTGLWTQVGTGASVVNVTASSFVTDGTATTQQLTGTGTFVAGEIDENSAQSSGISLPANGNTEIEFVLMVSSGGAFVAGDTVQFELSRTDAGSMNYTAASIIVITLSGGGVTVTPGTAALTLSPSAPTVLTPVTATPGVASLALAPQTPAVTVGINVVPGAASLSLAAQTPTVLAPRLVTPGTASLALAPQTPAAIVNTIVTPGVASLSITAQLPSAVLGIGVVPGTAALTLSPQIPTVLTPRLVTPGAASLILASFAPAVSTPRLITPGVASLSLTPFAPTVLTPVTATPGVAALSLTPFAPTVTATSGSDVVVTPGLATLALTAFAPTVTSSNAQVVTPGTVSLVLAAFAPSVSTPVVATPGLATLTLAPQAPAAVIDNRVVPGSSSLVLTPLAPTVTATDVKVATPGTAALVLTGFAPSVVLPVTATPGVGTLALTAFAPTVGFGVSAIPGPVGLTITLFPPVVTATTLALIDGITKSASGIPIGSCEVHLFRTADDVEVAQQTSDAGGYFAFSVADTTTHYYVVAYKVGSPDRAGTTRNDLTGA